MSDEDHPRPYSSLITRNSSLWRKLGADERTGRAAGAARRERGLDYGLAAGFLTAPAVETGLAAGFVSFDGPFACSCAIKSIRPPPPLALSAISCAMSNGRMLFSVVIDLALTREIVRAVSGVSLLSE